MNSNIENVIANRIQARDRVVQPESKIDHRSKKLPEHHPMFNRDAIKGVVVIRKKSVMERWEKKQKGAGHHRAENQECVFRNRQRFNFSIQLTHTCFPRMAFDMA